LPQFEAIDEEEIRELHINYFIALASRNRCSHGYLATMKFEALYLVGPMALLELARYLMPNSTSISPTLSSPNGKQTNKWRNILPNTVYLQLGFPLWT